VLVWRKCHPVLGGTRESTHETVGARLKRLRLERGLSQRDLASPGVSYAYISRIEAGARTPSVKALRMLAKKLGVSVEYLETGQDLRDSEQRELRLLDAELELRLSDDVGAAESGLERILDEARTAGDVVAARRARIALGIAAAERGNHLEAVERLEAVVSDEAPPPPRTHSDLYTTLGRSYAALGAPQRAVQLFEGCLREVAGDEPADTPLQVRYGAFLSWALSDAGQNERAADVVRSAMARAQDSTDPYTHVRLYWSAARLDLLEDRSADALVNIRLALALLKITDDTLMLGRAHLLAAGIELRESEPDRAQRHLALAERFLATSPRSTDLGMLRAGQSWLAGLEGNAELAVERARQALALFGDFYGGERGIAFCALARGLALQGDEAAADDAYRRGVDLLMMHGRRQDAANAASEWAQFLAEHGREDEAAPILHRAADLDLPVGAAVSRKQ
jgi:transcriptional regulator with XRE-family HTH domain